MTEPRLAETSLSVVVEERSQPGFGTDLKSKQIRQTLSPTIPKFSKSL